MNYLLKDSTECFTIINRYRALPINRSRPDNTVDTSAEKITFEGLSHVIFSLTELVTCVYYLQSRSIHYAHDVLAPICLNFLGNDNSGNWRYYHDFAENVGALFTGDLEVSGIKTMPPDCQ